MIKGAGAWLLRKQRSPRELNERYQAAVGRGGKAQCLAWSWRTMSEWVSEVGADEDEIISRKIREFERLVVLTRRPPVPGLHPGHRYVVETMQRELQRDQASASTRPYQLLTEPDILDDEDQQTALLAYALHVQTQLAFMEETERRRHMRLSEDADLDVDLHRFQAWNIAAPALRDLKRADRQYASARRRLLAPAYQALQVGVPASVLAAECGRTRQWVYQTTDPLKGHEGTTPLTSLTQFLEDFGVRHRGWRKGLVTSGELPLVAVDAPTLARVVEWIVDGDEKTETDATISRDQRRAILTFRREATETLYLRSDLERRFSEPARYIESDLKALTSAGTAVNTSSGRTSLKAGSASEDAPNYWYTPVLVKAVVTVDLPVATLVHPPKRGRPPGRSGRRNTK